MDRHTELSTFLTTRRARVVPAANPIEGEKSRRRVPGLRRSEAAARAGISTAYYIKLERGKVDGISAAVLKGLVKALELSDAETTYLSALVSVSGPLASPMAPPPHELFEKLKRVLDSMSIPAYVRNDRFEILIANPLAALLYAPVFAVLEPPANTVRYLFLNPDARAFWLDWDEMADQAVSYLRASAALDGHDQQLKDLTIELLAASPDFRLRWADNNVGFHQTGTKRFNHPVAGELTLDFQTFEVDGHAGLRLNTYAAAPGSLSAARLEMLRKSSG
jgi:transcriptional regulator with XRE-family HTH domain